MPLITINVINLNKEYFLESDFVNEITMITSKCLNKDPKVTLTQVQELTGLYLDSHKVKGECRLNIDIKVTKGTNNSEEKQAWINQVGDLINRFIPDSLNRIFYLSITELNADDWGYSGKTQAQRKLK